MEKAAQIKNTQSNIHSGSKAQQKTGCSLCNDDQVIQQTVGNQAVQRLVQTKLEVSSPGDSFEKEADQVAEQVMRKPADGSAVNISPVAAGVHRKCTECEDEQQHSGVVQTKRDAATDHSVDSAAVSMASKGQALSPSVRHFFEPRFGYDFSAVRVHTDYAAQAGNRSLHARAFTLGNNIAFNQGEYAPHSDSGKKLIAHELTHVIQQSGGHSTRPAVQANGGQFTEEELRNLQEYIAGLDPASEPPPPSQLDTNSLLMQYVANQMGAGNDARSHPSPNPFDQRSHPANSPYQPLLLGTDWQNGTDQTADGWSQPFPAFPDYNYGDLDLQFGGDSTCPGGACHSVNQAMRSAFYENLAAQRRRERLAKWPELHAQQHRPELNKQAPSLVEDMQRSDMAATQIRISLFDHAISPGSSVTDEIRSNWMLAQRASMFLESLLRLEDVTLSEEMTAPLGEAYANYFNAMINALLERDRSDRRLEESMANQPCPNCHRPNGGGFPEVDFDNSLTDFNTLFPDLQIQQPAFDPYIWMQNTVIEEPEPEPIGYRQQRLLDAAAQARSASSIAVWRNVLAEFHWATKEMDSLLVASAPNTKEGRKMVEQFDYANKLLERQRKFYNKHPNAIKIQAVFYPKPQTVNDLERREDDEGFMEDAARGIPWQFYLTHTAADSAENFEWQLHDITAPKRSDRTVKVTEGLTFEEVVARALGENSALGEGDPPFRLFKHLNHKDFFPEGHLYWTYPSGAHGDLETEASRTFWEWVRDIGITVAILGSIVFAPFSTPMLIAVGAGLGMSALGGYMRLSEMQEHGVATQRDVNQFYWGLALDIMSALTLGMGRVVQGAAQAGKTVQAAAASRYWFALQRAELGMNIANVGVVTYDFVQQYQAIENSNMTPEQKRAALEQLTMFGLLGGGLSLIPVATGLRDLRRGQTLHLNPDPGNPGRTIGTPDSGTAADLHQFNARPADDNAFLLGQAKGQNLNSNHSYGVWSDGRITRCSDPPCPDIAESIFGRIEATNPRMLGDSNYADDVLDLAERARQLRADATAAADAGDLMSVMPSLQSRARALDDEMAQLERNVLAESLDSIRPHLSNPDDLERLLARNLPDDLEVDFGDILARVARAGDYDPAHLARMVEVLRKMDPDTMRHLIDTRVQVNLNPNSKVMHDPDSIYWGRMRNSEEVSMLEGQLRGYGPSQAGEVSRRGMPGATPGATIDEASTPGGEHQITSLIGDPMPRQGLEDVIPPRSEINDPNLSNSLDIMVSERLHAIGAGFGAESGTGVAHGSSFINQFLQNRGVEALIRFLHRNRPDGVRYIVHVDVSTSAVGELETRMLRGITYRVTAVEQLPDGGFRPIRDMFEGTITHPENIRAASNPRGAGDIQGIGLEVEAGYGGLAEFFGL